MAKLEVTVCDICGENATTTRQIDVCSNHAGSLPTTTRGGRVTQRATAYKFPKSKCDYCDLEFAPQGMTPHIKTAHPEKLEEWRATKAKS